MNSKTVLAKFIACSCLIAACATSAFAASITKDPAGTDLTLGASWTGGTAPGASDAALWAGSSLGAGLTLGSAQAWGSIDVTGAASDISITGVGVLTVGNITLAGNNMTLDNPVALSGNSTWQVTGETLTANGRVSGTGALTLAGTGTVLFTNAAYTGGTTVSNTATAIFYDTVPGSSFALTNLATLVFTNDILATNVAISGGILIGSGTVIKQGPPNQTLTYLRINGTAVAMVPGSLIDVENGAIRNDNGNQSWRTNYASALVSANGMLDAWDGYMQVDALTGYGTISKGWSQGATFAMGAANGSGTFFGVISNNFNSTPYGGAAGGTFNIWKLGTGTQTLMGTNTYVGSTTISNGMLTIGGAGMLRSASSAAAVVTNYLGAINVVATTSIFNYASSQPLTLSGGGASGAGLLMLSGAGTLTLNGGTYACTITNITGGTIQISGSGVTTTISPSTLTGAGGAVVNDGAVLTMNVSGAAQWSPANLTLGNSAGCTLNFNGVTNSGTTTAPINPAAAVTHNGTVTVNVNGTADANIGVGSSYPLVANVSSVTGYTLGAQPIGWYGQLAVNNNTLVYTVTTSDSIVKAATGTELSAGASWVGAALPDAHGYAVWSNSVSSLGAGLTLGANVAWGAIIVSGAASDIAITGTGMLTNGSITLSGVNMGFSITNVLSGSSIWNIASGLTLTASNAVIGSGPLTLAGAGTAVLNTAAYTGGTVVNNAKLVIQNANYNGNPSANFTLTNSGTLVISNTASVNFQNTTVGINGSGTLLKTAPAGTTPPNSIFIVGGSSAGENIALTPGSLIDVEVGTIRNDYGNARWNNNYASAYVATNALLDVWDGYMQVDALNGYGTVSKGWSTGATFAMGANNGNGTFYGVISNNFNGGAYGGLAAASFNIIK